MLLKGSSTGDTLGFLGYCPQENALWLNLTVREHLEIFAAIKGMRKSDANVAIERYTGAAPVRFCKHVMGERLIHRKRGTGLPID